MFGTLNLQVGYIACGLIWSRHLGGHEQEDVERGG